MCDIRTERLRLIPLTLVQLRLCLDDPAQLEREMGIPLARDVITNVVRRAIGMKIAKMEQAEERDHPWYTYWLVVIADAGQGAGLAGFKGVPDAAGEAEIGYGIAPEFQRKGYTTEAARALIAWAFDASTCRAVIAPGTLKTNPASNRVLEKVGMRVYDETDDARSWRIDKARP